MESFDRKIRKASKEFQVPDSYHEKVDEILESIQGDHVSTPKRRPFVKAAIVMAAFCLVITGYLYFSSQVAEASFLDTFRQTIYDFLGIGKDESQEMGIESEKEEAVSKSDLLIQLQEVVMDTQNIYAVVKITAPTDVEFKEGMTFDYFGFCEGSNYNASDVVPGSRDCVLLETLKEKKNVATYVVNVSTDQQVKEGKEVTVFFKDLIAGVYEDTPDILVEGMWSLTFTAYYTDSEEIVVKGTKDMVYSVLDKEIPIQKIKLLPLGMTIISDMSNIPLDTLHTSDTRITIRFQMMDGSELLVDDPDPDTKILINGGSITEYEKNGKTLHKYVAQFEKAIDINQVLGIYIEDCYVPLKEYDE